MRIYNDKLPDILDQNSQKMLIIESKNGSLLAREKLILHNLRLVANIVNKKEINSEYDYEEIFQIAVVGLIKAIDSFDTNKNCLLSSYAYTCINNEISHYFRDNNTKYTKISLSENIGRDKDDSDMTLEATLFDETINIELEYELADQISQIKNIISTFSKYEQDIIYAIMYGINGEKTTQADIARLFHCSRNNISNIIKKLRSKIINRINYEEAKCKLKRR